MYMGFVSTYVLIYMYISKYKEILFVSSNFCPICRPLHCLENELLNSIKIFELLGSYVYIFLGLIQLF